MASGEADSADAGGMDGIEWATNPIALLGVAGLFGCLTVVSTGLARGLPWARRLFLVMTAASFGVAVGLRGVGSAADLPVPSAVPFAAMASFGSFAFHRAWSWVETKLV